MKELIICLTENKWYALDISNNDFTEDYQLSNRNKYYSFQVSDVIRVIKRDFKNVPEIVNIESFDKQFTQRGKDLMDFKRWHILKSLRNANIINAQYRITDIKDFLLKIKELINKLKDESKNEINRFYEIEVDINKIIHKTSFEGIRIDGDILDKKCIDLHRDIYKLKNEFQFSYNIFQPEQIEAQANYLKTNNYRILKSIKETISLLRKSDVVCEKFHNLNRLVMDLKTLMMLKSRLGGLEFVNPYFVGFGTITSRIIIKEPSLQNLKKTNRDVIIPNEGKELFYIDYSQFEASILAHYSSDPTLLKLINSDDIYSDIVKKVYKKEINEESRKEAKILFYRFLYGDTFEKNIKFKKQVETYFKAFKTLSHFKENLIKESLKNGFVNSDGNTRKLDIENENIWILSHLIQSKASLIFKKAIIDTYKKVENAKLLIPLHDGALYEIDKSEAEKIKSEIIEIYTQIFKKECNSLNNIQVKEHKFHN